VHGALNFGSTPLTGNLQKPITFHYSTYWWHQAPILKAQKSKLNKKDYLWGKFAHSKTYDSNNKICVWHLLAFSF
jgi:hypothetical protein